MVYLDSLDLWRRELVQLMVVNTVCMQKKKKKKNVERKPKQNLLASYSLL